MPRLLSVSATLIAMSTVLSVGCTSAAQKRQTLAAAAEVQAREAARAQAVAEAQRQAAALAKEQALRDRFSEATKRAAPMLDILRHWDHAGDMAIAQPVEIAAAVPRQAELQPLAALCAGQLPAVQEELLRTRARCALVARARDIVERQFLTVVRLRMGFPENLREAAKRYRRHGLIGWHELAEFEQMDAEMSRRTNEFRPLAAAIGLPLLGEPYKNGLLARREMQAAIRKGLDELAPPAGVADRTFETLLRPVVAALPSESGPLAGKRTEVLAVRAVDTAWQVLQSGGKPTRRDRRAVMTLRTADPTICAVAWLRIEQRAAGRKWAPPRASWDDDVRFVRCAAALPALVGKARPAERSANQPVPARN